MTLLRLFIEKALPLLDITDIEILQHISARRLSIGDEFIICDGMGRSYKYRIVKKKQGCITVERLGEINSFQTQRRLIYAQSLVRPRKLELIVSLGTQLGVEKFVFFVSRRSSIREIEIVKKRIDRLKKLAVASASVSRDKVPEIFTVLELSSLLRSFPQSRPLMLYENAEEKLNLKWLEGNNIENILLIIGPEGGFDGEEVQMVRENGGLIFSLGERILTSEMAGLVALSLIQFGV